ncbi:MFS transporter [Pantoea sp. S61]|uniref:MFS transporter n=1 Tax=Pantoea sp. S61 TaxID=2767442 RepID=UPI001F3F5600|nr:MFS transporter [Pantoea sp. S61]
MASHKLTARSVLIIGISQLINWGITFYMPGAFGIAIMNDTGWSSVTIFSGLTVAMLVMGIVSPFTSRFLSRFGGRKMMVSGTVLICAGCFMMSLAHSEIHWIAAWIVAGIGMRLSLYDAAFAVLVAAAGAGARKAISQVTLLGGLASAAFWPVAAGLLTVTDWRTALIVYGCTGLFSAACIFILPSFHYAGYASPSRAEPTLLVSRDDSINAFLYSILIALISFVSTGISTHFPAILASYGAPALTGALWGIGQVGARLLDVASGSRVPALRLNLYTGLLMPFCFAVGLAGAVTPAATAAFVLGYGAVNGLGTVVKAILPLVLFDPKLYARKTGVLLMPGFILSALAPSAYAALLSFLGTPGTLVLSGMFALVITAISVVMCKRGAPNQTLQAAKSVEERRLT